MLFSAYSAVGQVGIASYNQFPAMQPQHILDEKLENIGFAYSLRILESDYTGPLIRLRRENDNAEQAFFCAEDDRVDIDSIDMWRAGANVFVVVWYDQSGLNRNAIQNTANFQPRFNPDNVQPHFAGDGINDRLIVQATASLLIEDGKNASIYTVLFPITRNATAFGIFNFNSGNDRYITHINWGNGRCYFDPGFCCVSTNNRSFSNNVAIWEHYSFIRRDDPGNPNVDRNIIRKNGVRRLNGAFPDNQLLTVDYNFGICAASRSATGTIIAAPSTTRFSEMIMYKEGKSDDFSMEIEQNTVIFWNL